MPWQLALKGLLPSGGGLDFLLCLRMNLNYLYLSISQVLSLNDAGPESMTAKLVKSISLAQLAIVLQSTFLWFLHVFHFIFQAILYFHYCRVMELITSNYSYSLINIYIK